MFSGLLQPTHLIILVIIALVFLGPKRLPDAGRALGQALREFKKSVGGGHDEEEQIGARTSVAPEDKPRRREGQGPSSNVRSAVLPNAGAGEVSLGSRGNMKL